MIQRETRNLVRTTIDIDNRCNLPCDYCYLANKTKELIPAASIGKMFEATEQFGLLEEYIVGAEPTLHPELERILKETHILQRTGSTMITNGTTMTPEMVKLIRDSNLQRIAISIDGPDAESHNSRRGKNFDRVWRGLDLLQNTGKSITVISVAHQGNKDRLLDLSEILAKEGLADQHQIVAVSKSGVAIPIFDDMKLSLQDYDNIQHNVDAGHETLSAQGLDVVFASYFQATGKISEHRNNRQLTMFEYYNQLASSNAVINVRGDFQLATAGWHREFNSAGIVGNINSDDPAELLQKAEDFYKSGAGMQYSREAVAQERFGIGTPDVKIDLVPIMPVSEFEILRQNLDRAQLELISTGVSANPDRYRTVNVNSTPGIYVLFDKELSMVTLLREDEANLVEALTKSAN